MPQEHDGASELVAAVQRFKAGSPSRGPMFADFCASKKVPREYSEALRRAKIYEFPWGFVAETGDPGGYLWNCYVKAVWTSGTQRWWDRFLTAHKNIVHDEMWAQYEAATGRGFIISFDDGISSFSAASYGCITPEHTRAGRAWVADRLLAALWPEAVQKALDPSYKFAKNWRCA